MNLVHKRIRPLRSRISSGVLVLGLFPWNNFLFRFPRASWWGGEGHPWVGTKGALSEAHPGTSHQGVQNSMALSLCAYCRSPWNASHMSPGAAALSPLGGRCVPVCRTWKYRPLIFERNIRKVKKNSMSSHVAISMKTPYCPNKGTSLHSPTHLLCVSSRMAAILQSLMAPLPHCLAYPWSWKTIPLSERRDSPLSYASHRHSSW